MTTGVNMAQLLRERAQKHPDKVAVIVPGPRTLFGGPQGWQQMTYRELEAETDRIAHGLAKIGIKRGMHVTLMVKPSLEFFALTFALWKMGAVLVLVDPGMGMKSLGVCLAEAKPEAFVGIPLAHVARIVLGWAKNSLRILVTVGRRWFWRGHRLADIRATSAVEPYPIALMPPDEMASILFSSGSTGIAKGAVYTHGIFTSQVQYLQEDYGFGDDEIDMATFPLFALLDIGLGLTVVVPDMDATKPGSADPNKLLTALRDHKCTMMFGSPALVNNLSRFGVANNIKVPTLRRVISCGAPARPDVLARMQQMLPEKTEIFTPYGATEALPIATIGSHAILGETRVETQNGGGTCVGRPNEHVTVRIIQITDEPIPEWRDDLALPVGQIGEIVSSGPIVTREYYSRPEQTALAKIRGAPGSPQTLWHRMGDVGRLDDRGRLWFCGRKAHRVTTANGTLYTIPCEAVFNQHPAVYRTALVGVPPALPGGKPPSEPQRPVICVELEVGHRGDDRQKLTRELLELGAKHAHTKCIDTVLFHDGFPVDIRHNAKINREQLAAWAAMSGTNTQAPAAKNCR